VGRGVRGRGGMLMGGWGREGRVLEWEMRVVEGDMTAGGGGEGGGKGEGEGEGCGV